MIPVRQVRVLPPASSRLLVTEDALALGYILPTAGRIRDLHPLERAPAGRTAKKNPRSEERGFYQLGFIRSNSL